jgi:hypothetical protein
MEPPVAGHARIGSIQIRPVDIGSFSEIRAGIDRLGDCGANTRKLRMQRVIELRDSEYARRLNLFRILVASRAHCRIR